LGGAISGSIGFKHVGVVLLPDPSGGEWPRVMIEWKFDETKEYLGQKDA
jgi:hypothetical protein